MAKHEKKRQTANMKRNKAVEDPDIMMPRRSNGFANCPQQPIMKEFSSLDTEQMFKESQYDDYVKEYELGMRYATKQKGNG